MTVERWMMAYVANRIYQLTQEINRLTHCQYDSTDDEEIYTNNLQLERALGRRAELVNLKLEMQNEIRKEDKSYKG